MTTDSTLTSTRASPPQDANAPTDAISASQTSQKPQNQPSTESLPRVNHPRAAAAAANAVMSQQVKEEQQPMDVALAKALSVEETPKPVENDTQYTGRRPSRAAAAAANAVISHQVKEEESSLMMLIAATASSSLEQDEQLNVKKRSTEKVNEPTAKRSKMNDGLMSKKTPQNTLKEVSGGSQSRGKKRRQAAVFEAAPIITDMPPLPFTTSSPALKVKNKGKTKKVKSKMGYMEADGENRSCEFCKKVTNVCVQMHCHGCRREYHAGCLLSAFKPYVDTSVPILQQMERIQLESPERRGNIFRCASCKAAFLDFYESGGVLWDCACPTCTQPEKLIYYRQRKLVQMMNDMELEKQRKKDLKDQKSKKKVAGKPPAPTPSRSNSTSRSRRTRGSSATPDEHVISARTTRPSMSRGVSSDGEVLKHEIGAVKAEASDVINDVESGLKNLVGKGEPMEVDSIGCQQTESTTLEVPQANVVEQLQIIELEQQTDQKIIKQEDSNPTIAKGDEHKQKMDLEAESGSEAAIQSGQSGEINLSAKLENSKPTMDQPQEHQALKAPHEPVGEPEKVELSGDDLVGAVRVVRDDTTGGWCFPVMCSRTSNLRESGVMKSGLCKWLPNKSSVVQCECCDKFFYYSQFVHHTDSSLAEDAKCANEDPMPFLFVQHRDTTQYTPLDKFLPDFRIWAQRQSAFNTLTKPRRSHAVKQESLSSIASSQDAIADDPPSAPSRLRALALFKRPKHRSEKGPIVARLADPANMEFVAQVVCLPPSYVMTMTHGALVDRVTRSQPPVPGDSFPRKSGWLAFSRNAATARQITCVCCEKRFSSDEFVEHAGISLSELKIKSRQLLYIVEHQDESALVPYKTFLLDLEFITKNNLFLDELRLPSNSIART